MKLWLYFALFTVTLFGALWMLQTVFLQNFYNKMVERNVEKIAAQIVEERDSADFADVIDRFAYNNSVLIFLTDWGGNVLYHSDEHSPAYRRSKKFSRDKSGGKVNPYQNNDGILNWQLGALNFLPEDYPLFLRRLSESAHGRVSYQVDNETVSGVSLVYGAVIPASGDAGNFMGHEESVLYITTSLGAMNSTTAILRTQLIWGTLASLAFASAIAYFIARRFSRPIATISKQAAKMANGNFEVSFEKGFCLELDELSDTLHKTAHELSKAENLRREIMANISHDLRTPLTMIKGYAEMIRDISGESREKRETHLSVIMRETERLTELVNDILDHSALQSDSGNGHTFERVNLSSLVHEVIERFRPISERGGFYMETSVIPDLYVVCDKKRLTQVLYNLIDNAFGHLGNDKEVRISLTDTGRNARIEVADHGTGISQDELPHIWERYFTSKEQKRAGIRTGLGLAITKEILTAHHAEFGVESVLGEGSAFWFEILKS